MAEEHPKEDDPCSPEVPPLSAHVPPQFSLAVLLQRVADRDPAAQTELFHRYYDRAASFVAPFTRRNDFMQQTIVSETFTTVFEKISQLKSADSFLPWLHVIARHASLNYIRRATREREIYQDLGHNLDFIIQENAPVWQAMETDAIVQLVHDAIGQLKPKQRKLIGALLAFDLNAKKAAESLDNMKLSTFRWHVEEGLKALRLWFQNQAKFNP